MRLSCGQNRLIGRSGEAQTRGLRIPNAARYQLRYTPIVIKLWSCKWSNLWSNIFLTAIFCFPNRPKSARLKGFLRFSLSCGAKTAYAPKPGAIPTSLYPDIHFSAIIPRRRGKSKIFMSVVIYVVKGDFVPLSATRENPANAGVARLSGVSRYSVSDTATALPNHPRYQLRHTRLYLFFSQFPAYWLSAIHPRRFSQKHSRIIQGSQKGLPFWGEDEARNE